MQIYPYADRVKKIVYTCSMFVMLLRCCGTVYLLAYYKHIHKNLNTYTTLVLWAIVSKVICAPKTNTYVRMYICSTSALICMRASCVLLLIIKVKRRNVLVV